MPVMSSSLRSGPYIYLSRLRMSLVHLRPSKLRRHSGSCGVIWQRPPSVCGDRVCGRQQSNGRRLHRGDLVVEADGDSTGLPEVSVLRVWCLCQSVQLMEASLMRRRGENLTDPAPAATLGLTPCAAAQWHCDGLSFLPRLWGIGPMALETCTRGCLGSHYFKGC